MRRIFKVSGEQLERLRESFPSATESWFKRCKRRVELGDVYRVRGGWIVRGRRSMGDYSSTYYVRRQRDRYVCDCHGAEKPYGAKRAREGCTHVGAVLLAEYLKAVR